MKNKKCVIYLLAVMYNISLLQFYGQNVSSSNIKFLNSPVLYKQDGDSYQQVIANYNSRISGNIVFKHNGLELLEANVVKGNNKYLLTFPLVTKPKNIIISVTINEIITLKHSVTLQPPKKWKIYFVQHSHTDIGYTRPQSEILAEHLRYIDYAIDYCDQTDNMPDDAKFRWTCESAWVTREYLRSRPAEQIERFKKRIEEGRIEVTGMYANMAEISDENLMYDFLQPLKEFNKWDIPVNLAMQNDVNGIAWCLPEYFKNTGVKYLIMGIHKARSILPFEYPTVFWWEAPSGSRLLAFRADHYMTGNFFGIESINFQYEDMLWYLADLDNKGYPFDRIGIQFSGYRTDNAPPSTAVCELIKKWNTKYEYPKLRLAVASEFLDYIRDNYVDEIPVYRNAWLDWWSDGFGSTSRETAEVRKTQNIKQVSEGLLAMVSMMGGELNPSLELKSDHISENIIFFNEHTCGANESIRNPFSENSIKQWLQKGAYAWEALKRVTLLREEALARFQPFLKKSSFPILYIINSMGWERTGDIEVFIDNEIIPAEKKVRIIDLATGYEAAAQMIKKRPEGAYWIIEVNDIPAMGYKAFKIEVIDQSSSDGFVKNVEILENKFYKITIDKITGAINSLFDKELNLELVDNLNQYKIGQPVRETLLDNDRRKLIPEQSIAYNVRIEPGAYGNVWESIKVAMDLDGYEKGIKDAPKGIDCEIRLFKNVKKIELKYMARKEILTDPEALYVAFPFSLPDSRIVFETIGGTLTQGQQLPGSSADWNVAQNFVAVRGKIGQIIIISNEIPLWHFSDFNLGKFERYPKQDRTSLYSWVMNNYWVTNFRAYQEGAFSWTYHITSTSDTTNTYATKFSWGERNPFLTRTLPAGLNELKTPSLETLKITGSDNVLLVNSRPVFKDNGTLLLRFREVEGQTAEVKILSLLPDHSIKNITEVNSVGHQIGTEISTIQLKPYEVKFIEVKFE